MFLLFRAPTLLLVLVAGSAGRASAQAPLFLANAQTTVRGIHFTFPGTRTFEEALLQEQIATQEPGFSDRARRILPFTSPPSYPLDRIELQKDVVRLRRFYERNGFPSPRIAYSASQLDTTHNAIRIIFTIEEGPPLIIQDVGFFGPEGGYAANLFSGDMRDRWIRFRDRTSFKTGDRFTDFDLIRIQDQVVAWLKDQGYAFAQLRAETFIYEEVNTVDIHFDLDPGPRGYFADIEVVGNAQVTDKVVRRELPFKAGDQFSNSKLVRGQRELFGLNLFRVALANVPPAVETADSLHPGVQLRDSTVTVRFEVRESRLRYLSAQTGYDQEKGLLFGGQWSHRNFFGGARHLSIGLTAETGFAASVPTGTEVSRLFRGSVSLRQPYLFVNGLSGIFGPFLQYKREPLLPESDLFLGLNQREFGVNTQLIYEILPFRTVNLQYTLSQVFTPSTRGALLDERDDVYSKSVLSLNGTFGRVNNFLNPRRGFLVRPLVEQAGQLLPSGVEYLKTETEVIGYIPITRRISVGTRLSVGRIWPLGRSRGLVPFRDSTDFLIDTQFAQPTEDRFDDVRFYVGGSNDVRGWDWRLVGPKYNETTFVLNDDGTIKLGADGLPETQSEQFNEVGGLARLVGNIEVRFPLPGFGNAWRGATFLDFGQVSAETMRGLDCEQAPPLPPGQRDDDQCGFRDDGRLHFDQFKYGLGGGLRYETPIGYLRIDIAFKVNPDDLDLQTPRNAFLFEQGFLDAPKKAFFRRFNLHVSLGQAF